MAGAHKFYVKVSLCIGIGNRVKACMIKKR